MPQPLVPLPVTPVIRRRTEAEPLRRRQLPSPAPSLNRRRALHLLFALVAVVLLADAFVGERGFLETARARREAAGEMARVAALREENARLREEKRRLTEDPAMIESEARQQLGLARPGEVMFILKDIKPVDATRPATGR